MADGLWGQTCLWVEGGGEGARHLRDSNDETPDGVGGGQLEGEVRSRLPDVVREQNGVDPQIDDAEDGGGDIAVAGGVWVGEIQVWDGVLL